MWQAPAARIQQLLSCCLRCCLLLRVAGRELEALAREAGFKRATHYEIAFGLMGVLVATKA